MVVGENSRKQVSIRMNVGCADFGAVYANIAMRGGIKAQQQIEETGFARTISACYENCRAAFYIQTNGPNFKPNFSTC